MSRNKGNTFLIGNECSKQTCQNEANTLRIENKLLTYIVDFDNDWLNIKLFSILYQEAVQ